MAAHAVCRKVKEYCLWTVNAFIYLIGRRISLVKGSVQTYPYVESCPTGPSRTKDMTRSHAKDAVEVGSPVSYYYSRG